MSFLRFFTATRRALPQTMPLLRDLRVPLWLKVTTIAVALLIVSPLDLFGDIPVLGALDDALLLALLLNGFVSAATRYVRTAGFATVEAPMRRAQTVAVRQLSG